MAEQESLGPDWEVRCAGQRDNRPSPDFLLVQISECGCACFIFSYTRAFPVILDGGLWSHPFHR